jgi:nucleotide-binding universal stress UspA family protein
VPCWWRRQNLRPRCPHDAERDDRHSLCVVTVLTPLPVLPSEYPAAMASVGLERELEHSRRQLIEHDMRTALGSDAPELTMLIGNPAGAIASAARASRARCVVVGLGRRGPMEHLFGGETALRLARQAPMPVLAVSPGAEALPSVAVLAIDFSEASKSAARAALDLLADGATVHLIHVRPEVDIPLTDPRGWDAVYESGARDLLAHLVTELQALRPDAQLRTELLHGRVAEEILRYAAHVGAELIAVGQHGHRALAGLFVGGTTTSLLRGANCSVLSALSRRSRPTT